ncbi:hypothetical protein L1887_34619 [Cichorium endivia]|nr:hypothetical protein L1887_34619 [Cichorium endivia]
MKTCFAGEEESPGAEALPIREVKVVGKEKSAREEQSDDCETVNREEEVSPENEEHWNGSLSLELKHHRKEAASLEDAVA